MLRFVVQEIKEIVIEAVVEGSSADEALMKYKNRSRRDLVGIIITKVSEESHITTDPIKEEK